MNFSTGDSILTSTQAQTLVADGDEHAWFCSSLETLQRRLREDSSASNFEVLSALLAKTLEDHWIRLSHQSHHREEELKRIINLLTKSAGRLDPENKQFYVELRKAVQGFQNVSQLEDITFIRKKLSEQVAQLQESVSEQEVLSQGTIGRLQAELDQAHHRIATLTQVVSSDSLTRLPMRPKAEGVIRQLIEEKQPFTVAVAVLDRLDLMNLRYGPECGDDILRRFAIEFREQLPQRVFLCRWGGPAFVAVIERLPAGDVRSMVQKILNNIAAEPVEMPTKGVGLIRLTSRFVVHQWKANETPEKLVKLVDTFCFEEKRAGLQETDPSPAKLVG